MKIIKDKSISNIFINEIDGPIIIDIGIIEISIFFLIYHLIRKKFYAKL